MSRIALCSAALVFGFLLLVCIDEAGRIDKR
jgi:hypothetical protein